MTFCTISIGLPGDLSAAIVFASSLLVSSAFENNKTQSLQISANREAESRIKMVPVNDGKIRICRNFSLFRKLNFFAITWQCFIFCISL